MIIHRWTSIDFLRGLTVAAMILVNNPGAWEHIYPFLHHAVWHGCTLADLVFPFFIIVMGISIVLSLYKTKTAGTINSEVLIKIVRRSLILILLGLFLNWVPDFSLNNLRWPGVLQRLGLVYFFCAILYLYSTIGIVILSTGLILITYWLMITTFPIPGIGEPNLNPTTNLAAWIDNMLMEGHLWKYSKVWDPEGLLSTLPAISSGLIGVLIGYYLKIDQPLPNKLRILSLAGVLFVILGLLSHQIFPMNKSLWTSSYVLFTSGVAIIILTVSSYCFEIKNAGTRCISFFLAFGYNPITAYFLSELVAKMADFITVSNGQSIKAWMFETLYASWLPRHLASFLMAVSWLLIFYIPLYIMYRRKILIKI